MIIKRKAITSPEPITTGISNWLSASTISFPRPFHPKTYSTKIDSAKRDANHPETAVITKFKEFLEHA